MIKTMIRLGHQSLHRKALYSTSASYHLKKKMYIRLRKNSIKCGLFNMQLRGKNLYARVNQLIFSSLLEAREPMLIKYILKPGQMVSKVYITYGQKQNLVLRLLQTKSSALRWKTTKVLPYTVKTIAHFVKWQKKNSS